VIAAAAAHKGEQRPRGVDHVAGVALQLRVHLQWPQGGCTLLCVGTFDIERLVVTICTRLLTCCACTLKPGKTCENFVMRKTGLLMLTLTYMLYRRHPRPLMLRHYCTSISCKQIE
jgi:hypothetical protein